MQVGNVTTPFGRRPMTLALVKSQMRASQIEPGKSVDKWKVFRDACDARSLLNLRDRALAVLNALLTFYPEAALSAGSGERDRWLTLAREPRASRRGRPDPTL